MILVTGGAGFIGANFVLDWIANGDEPVVNLDKLTYAGNLHNLDSVQGNPRHIFVQGDIGDTALLERLLAEHQPRAIVNFAAESHVDRSIHGPEDFIQTNVVGTFRLLEAARQYWQALPAIKKEAFRFLHVSTDEVYGSVETGHSVETDNLEPNSPYAASKAASDLLVRSYFVTHKAPVLTTRASNNYGPYQYPEKALPLMITNFMENKPFPMYGDGRQVRDWLHAVDHGRAILTVLEKGTLGEIYNIGGSFDCENRELIARVLKLMGKPSTLITPVEDRKGHDRRYALDCSKLLALGFKHKYDFDAGLRETIEWYEANEKWWRPLKVAGGYRTYLKKAYKK